MKHIMSNLNSITAVSTLFQEFSQELPIFAQANDVFLFKTVYDSVSVVYPDSKLVAALNNQIIQRYNVSELQKMVNNAGELAFPEITMPDINGQEQKLSSLNGKVIPSGIYDTLLITIGEGEGSNYWSLLYPEFFGITFEDIDSIHNEI